MTSHCDDIERALTPSTTSRSTSYECQSTSCPDGASEILAACHPSLKLGEGPKRVGVGTTPADFQTFGSSGSWPCKNAGARGACRTIFLQIANGVASVPTT